MKGLKNLLLKEQFRLENIIKETKERLALAPEGRLRLSKSHNHIQYYCCTEEKKSGDYIPKGMVQLANKLAQKAYDEKILQLANVRLAQIKKLTRDYTDDEFEKIYLKEHTERKKLISSHALML